MDEIKKPDYFLKIEGIEGEASDSKHGKEIQIAGFKMNVINRGRQGNYTVGKTVFDDAQFFAEVDQAYSKIQEACAKGDHLSKATLTCRNAGKNQQDYLKIIFLDLFITSCKLNTQDDQLPLVEFTISFVKQSIEYREQKADGTLAGPILAEVNLQGKRSGS